MKIPDLVRTLYCGDNLPILRTRLASESIDLIYLDPPFYSQKAYQAVFKRTFPRQHGLARAPAFVDVWRWLPETERFYEELLISAPEAVKRTITALRGILSTGSLLAYLVMMAERLLELHRVLKATGSVYLHCDPVAGHYLKILMDAVFGVEHFQNEIVWGYKTGGASHRHFSRKHDLIFFYSKSDQYRFHALKEKSYMMHRYGFKKSTFLRDARGEYTWVYMKDVWELPAVGSADGQRLGYPTQKPEALLERIILASSNEGETVLDPFCGSGTTLAVAQRLGRGWLGIENHYLGIAYQRYRLACAFPTLYYTFAGGPSTLEDARVLARANPLQFRWWALALVKARPMGEEKQGQPAHGNGLLHGILSADAGPRAQFFVTVCAKEPDSETLQHLRAALSTREASGLLIITLEAFELLIEKDRLSPSPGVSALSIEVVTIADLLQQPA